MTPEAAEILARLTKKDAPSGLCSIIMFALGGAASEVADDACSLESRDYKYWIIIEGKWKPSRKQDQNDLKRQKIREWTNVVRKELAPYGLKESVHVFEGENEKGGHGCKVFEETNLDRLIALKAKHDPENIFCFNKILNKGGEEKAGRVG